MVRFLQEQASVTGERYLYRNTLDDDGMTVDYGFDTLNVIETVNEEGRTYRVYDNGARLAVSPEADYRPYGNVFGATEHFFDDLNLYAGETDREVLKQKPASGDYVILGIEANRLTGEPKAMPFDSQLQVGDQITFYKNGEPFKACTILALSAVVPTEILYLVMAAVVPATALHFFNAGTLILKQKIPIFLKNCSIFCFWAAAFSFCMPYLGCMFYRRNMIWIE